MGRNTGTIRIAGQKVSEPAPGGGLKAEAPVNMANWVGIQR